MAKISQALAIVCLVLNVIILPGLGTLIARATQKKELRNGIWQIVLAVVGAPLVLALGLGILMIAAAWIWALIDSIIIIQESG